MAYYRVSRGTSASVHPWLADLETKVIRAEACMRAARKLDADGFSPDVIVAHPGWGESLFLKQVWPKAWLGLYCEFFYKESGADTGFDPEFPGADLISERCRLALKNANNLLHFEVADAGLSPTQWQANTFPTRFRERISVIHDGIDTDLVAPNADASFDCITAAGRRLSLSRQDQVVTFVNRNLEPYRGYHTFMRALPGILRRNTGVEVVIVGGADVSYGAKPDPALYGARTWKDIFIDEVRSQVSDADWRRVHFVGHLEYSRFVCLLQVSSVHVYLTYPFVLSWSLLEAMSAGCAIVASDTAPVHEVVHPGETGELIDFFDVQGLATRVLALLNDPGHRQGLGARARQLARQTYDLRSRCLPGQVAWVERASESS